MSAHSSHRAPCRCFPTHPTDRVDQKGGPQPWTWRVLQRGPVVPDIVDIAAIRAEEVRAGPERPMTTPVSRRESPVMEWPSFAFVYSPALSRNELFNGGWCAPYENSSIFYKFADDCLRCAGSRWDGGNGNFISLFQRIFRSEERRVGKECRSWWVW